ncbi:MAG TPA: ParB N-terminal domain-containing protein [Kofleriaceae bacterium]
MTVRVSKIAPALAKLSAPVGTVTPHPENYRRGNVDAIAQSLQRFGQVRPIVAQDSTGRIVAGNHTYLAAVQLGWTHVAVARVELSDDDARSYLVADNRLSDVAENDDDALAALLNALALDGKLEGTGYDNDEVDDLLETLAAVDWDTPTEDPPAKSSPSRGAGPMPHREVVLMMTVEQKTTFDASINRLRGVYDTEGTAQTVLAVVAEAVKRADA